MSSLPLPSYACIDSSLPNEHIDHLRHVFRADGSFWAEHDYDALATNASRRVGYFSYLYPFQQRAAVSSVEIIMDHIFSLVKVAFPDIGRKATVGCCCIGLFLYC